MAAGEGTGRAGRPLLIGNRAPGGGGPGEGCAPRPVGTYLYLHAVGARNLVAVLGLAR
jgi:hypothetical protein